MFIVILYHRVPPCYISQKCRAEFFHPAEFNGKITRLSSHCICGIKRAGRVDKKSGAANFAVFIGPMNFDDRLGGSRKDVLDVLAYCRGGLLPRAEQTPA